MFQGIEPVSTMCEVLSVSTITNDYRIQKTCTQIIFCICIYVIDADKCNFYYCMKFVSVLK